MYMTYTNTLNNTSEFRLVKALAHQIHMTYRCWWNQCKNQEWNIDSDIWFQLELLITSTYIFKVANHFKCKTVSMCTCGMFTPLQTRLIHFNTISAFLVWNWLKICFDTDKRGSVIVILTNQLLDGMFSSCSLSRSHWRVAESLGISFYSS